MQLIDLLAELSKLSLTSKEKEKLKTQLKDIINYVSQVKTLDTKGIEPTYHTNIKKSVLRRDKYSNSRQLDIKAVLQNAKRTKNTYFVVDAVL